MALEYHFAAIRPVLLLGAVAVLAGCQSLSRVSIESLLGEPPPSMLEKPDAGKPEIISQPPPRADTFVLTDETEVVGRLYVVLAAEKDTLFDIARRYGLGYREIRAANPGVDPWLPKSGTSVILPTRFVLPEAPREGIILNLAAMRLYYYPKPNADQAPVVITHPVAIGRQDWPTPRGLTKVISKVKDPSWYVPASIRAEHAARGAPLPAVVPPGPDNPLGRHALRLALPSYLIHGTNKPAGIGMRVTHGCAQLYPEDIASLYSKVPVGTPVRIVDQTDLAGWDHGVLHLESHPGLEETQDPEGRLARLQETLERAVGRGRSADIDWQRAVHMAENGRGLPVPIERDSPGIEEVIAAAPVHRGAAEASGPDSAVEDGASGWYVQAGSFKNPDAAERLSLMLGQLGPPVSARAVPSGGYHRVLAGPFRDRQEAEETARRIESSLGAEAFIVERGG